jgi:excisionase family DNA binding protein
MTEAHEIVVRIQLEYPPGTAAGAESAMAADEPLLCDVREAARLLAVGSSTVNELIARGELESVKIGASRRITRAGIEAYVTRLLAEEKAAEREVSAIPQRAPR